MSDTPGVIPNMPIGSHQSSTSAKSNTTKRKEIYRYNAPWCIFSMNWSVRPDKRFRLAVGSFIEEYNNKVQIIYLDDEQGEFVVQSTFAHHYPTSKIMWIPDTKCIFPDLLATSGDYLRVWRINEDSEVKNECLLNNNKNSDYCAPLTSFDWNEVDPNIIGTSSIDTTCTIWALETEQVIGHTNVVSGRVESQLIAHDKEVYDIAFSRAGGGRDVFASVGADGSVRMFDLRHLEHSNIVYEDSNHSPLLRLAWNKQDANYLATFAMDSVEIIILDLRVPCTPVARLNNHRAFVNGLAWAPHSSCHLCTASEDCQALIWDIQSMPRAIEDPILAYTAAGEINQIQWSSTQPDWIAICYNNSLEILRV
ncbi:unnamed protein product [Schistosoma margrebowiei]|uniref:DDB1- and CUL4-associated factor 7 n=1 Tax=Schistosoma margrebowiei TaxID=48269 RepID=A0A183MJD3_9TREM|nr:unnamed protein product [Schistosoma margrebowiei]